MSSEQAGAQTRAQLSTRLCEAMHGPQTEFFDALYDVEGTPAGELREIVSSMCEQTKTMFEQARAKLAGGRVELSESLARGDNWVSLVKIVGGPQDGVKLELIVADVFERDASVHTRDVIQMRVVP